MSGIRRSGMLGTGVQACSHCSRCSGVPVLVSRLLCVGALWVAAVLVCCPGGKCSEVLVQVGVVLLGVVVGDGILLC